MLGLFPHTEVRDSDPVRGMYDYVCVGIPVGLEFRIPADSQFGISSDRDFQSLCRTNFWYSNSAIGGIFLVVTFSQSLVKIGCRKKSVTQFGRTVRKVGSFDWKNNIFGRSIWRPLLEVFGKGFGCQNGTQESLNLEQKTITDLTQIFSLKTT